MPGASAKIRCRTGGPGALRLSVIPALIGLLLMVAAPAASAAGPVAPHGRIRALAPGCTGADVPASGGSARTVSAAMLCLINQQRAAHDLPGLRENVRLDRVAQAWTSTMVRTGSFSHGTNFTGRIGAVGYDWQMAGENIGSGYATPRQLVTAYMASRDHCRNILNPAFADLGTGVLARGVGRYGPSTWTQDFGLSMGQAAPSSNTGPMSACPYG